ncbi:MAG: hypothetical protein PF692_03255 [Kiritimatiellae bacterium]|jgi:hypothetical protein|nr:hypothetical protein [Kiritimatiellia bacterium]
MRLIKHISVGLCLLSFCGSIFAEKNAQSYVEKIDSNFIELSPSVKIEYLITYKVWFITLAHVAKATVETTEGVWVNSETSTTNKATKVELSYYTYDQEKDEKRSRISMNDKILTVLTMPELDTIIYTKDTDEYMNPLFKTPTIVKNFEVYEMLPDGSLDYFREDFTSGTITTNMDGAAELIEQGKGISSNIKMISEMYYGKQEFITHDSDYRIHFNVDGVVKPFSVTSNKEKAPVKLKGKEPESIKVRAQLAKEATGKGGAMNFWAAPFKDIANLMNDKDLLKAGKNLPEWSVVPLVMDYDLKLGFIRCSIDDISIDKEEEEKAEK